MRIGIFLAAAFAGAFVVGLFWSRAMRQPRWTFWAVAIDGPCKDAMSRMDAAHHVWDFCDVREPGVRHRYVKQSMEIGDVTTVWMRWSARVDVGPLPVDHKWNQE